VYAVARSCNVSFLRSAQAERCSIFIVDPESDELVSHVRASGTHRLVGHSPRIRPRRSLALAAEPIPAGDADG
jgi:hypothetical protein